jgi:SRSO17 transposase
VDILEHPDAQLLLDAAALDADAVRSCAGQLQAFAQRYLPHFARREQREHALVVLKGKLTGLQRKTTEPIARQARLDRRPLQLFVGAAKWDDRALLGELRRHAALEIGDDEGVFVLDGSGFPKKGDESCGVARQWCGRLGKIDNCQVGCFLGYVGRRGKALLDAALYLPREWADDGKRRAKTYVPEGVEFREKWRIALGQLDEATAVLPGAWVTGDDEYGRSTELRAELRQRRLSYVLDVPCNTLVRDVAERRPPSKPGGKPRRPAFERADAWVARQPKGRWRKVKVRGGEKGPIESDVLSAVLQVKDEDGRVGPRERLVVLRSREKEPRTTFTLSNAREARRGEVAGVRGKRHGVEELLGQGKGEIGLGQYEVRSWVGWHHHMTLSLLALWFLQLERLRLGGKNAGGDGQSGAGGVHGTAAGTGGERDADRGGGERGSAA